ncbi:hypothetical protein FACS189465_1400 [Clostridia bacterium]|nr:hypothetical protein FACS189465_1400 [Clostridia bacterium]
MAKFKKTFYKVTHNEHFVKMHKTQQSFSPNVHKKIVFNYKIVKMNNDMQIIDLKIFSIYRQKTLSYGAPWGDAVREFSLTNQ